MATQDPVVALYASPTDLIGPGTAKALGLTGKQAAFVYEYTRNGFDGQAAAISAGYSPKAAMTTASSMLTMNKIQRAIAVDLKAQRASSAITKERVLLEVARVAFADPRQGFEPVVRRDGSVRSRILQPHEWGDDFARAVKKFKIKLEKNVATGELDEVVEIELWDKPKANEMLGRHLRLFEAEKLGVDDSRQGAVLEAARRRILDMLEGAVRAQAPALPAGPVIDATLVRAAGEVGDAVVESEEAPPSEVSGTPVADGADSHLRALDDLLPGIGAPKRE